MYEVYSGNYDSLDLPAPLLPSTPPPADERPTITMYAGCMGSEFGTLIRRRRPESLCEQHMYVLLNGVVEHRRPRARSKFKWDIMANNYNQNVFIYVPSG